MSDTVHPDGLFQAFDALVRDPEIRERAYYPDFRRAWEAVLRSAAENTASYLPENPQAIYTVCHSWGGFELALHFDQLKIADWYAKEMNRRSQQIFVPKRLKRSRTGTLTFHDSVCSYNPEAPESALSDNLKNIVACALPGLPPPLHIVYGNKWVNARFTPLKRGSLSLFLLNTDYVPAFLCSPLEVCLYLFLMDCCICKENCGKVPDDELRKLLHIFRPSPMLAIKGLLPHE